MSTAIAARELPTWTDPAELYASGPARMPASFWLDAGPDARSGWSWLGFGAESRRAPREVICEPATHSDRPHSDRPHSDRPHSDRAEARDEGGPFRGGWVGWIGYDSSAAGAGAPRAADPTVPEELGIRVDRFVAIDHVRRRQWAFAPEGELDAFFAQVRGWRGAPTEVECAEPRTTVARHTPDEYARLIERCREAIRRGDAYQLCLTTRFSVDTPPDEPVDALAAYLRLRQDGRSHHGGLISAGGYALASASPEQFLTIAGGVVRTRPIKGTRPRSPARDEDDALAEQLRHSVKERAENVMIVDLMRNDLQRVCVPGTVAAERLLEIESYPAVHQLVSTIAGRLRAGTTIADALSATFPAGSMTGAPKLSAMGILHSLEQSPRGVYSGCFGWIGHDGRADLAMVIRSIVVHPAGAYVGAGGGITWRSIAAEEVAEVSVKAAVPLAALGGHLPDGW